MLPQGACVPCGRASVLCRRVGGRRRVGQGLGKHQEGIDRFGAAFEFYCQTEWLEAVMGTLQRAADVTSLSLTPTQTVIP